MFKVRNKIKSLFNILVDLKEQELKSKGLMK